MINLQMTSLFLIFLQCPLKIMMKVVQMMMQYWTNVEKLLGQKRLPLRLHLLDTRYKHIGVQTFDHFFSNNRIMFPKYSNNFDINRLMIQENPQVIHQAREQKQKEHLQLCLNPHLQNQQFQSQIRLPHSTMFVLIPKFNQHGRPIDMAMGQHVQQVIISLPRLLCLKPGLPSHQDLLNQKLQLQLNHHQGSVYIIIVTAYRYRRIIS